MYKIFIDFLDYLQFEVNFLCKSKNDSTCRAIINKSLALSCAEQQAEGIIIVKPIFFVFWLPSVL